MVAYPTNMHIAHYQCFSSEAPEKVFSAAEDAHIEYSIVYNFKKKISTEQAKFLKYDNMR